MDNLVVNEGSVFIVPLLEEKLKFVRYYQGRLGTFVNSVCDFCEHLYQQHYTFKRQISITDADTGSYRTNVVENLVVVFERNITVFKIIIIIVIYGHILHMKL